MLAQSTCTYTHALSAPKVTPVADGGLLPPGSALGPSAFFASPPALAPESASRFVPTTVSLISSGPWHRAPDQLAFDRPSTSHVGVALGVASGLVGSEVGTALSSLPLSYTPTASKSYLPSSLSQLPATGSTSYTPVPLEGLFSSPLPQPPAAGGVVFARVSPGGTLQASLALSGAALSGPSIHTSPLMFTKQSMDSVRHDHLAAPLVSSSALSPPLAATTQCHPSCLPLKSSAFSSSTSVLWAGSSAGYSLAPPPLVGHAGSDAAASLLHRAGALLHTSDGSLRPLPSGSLDTSPSQPKWASAVMDFAPSPPPLSIALQVPNFSLPAFAGEPLGVLSGTGEPPSTLASQTPSFYLSTSSQATCTTSSPSLCWSAHTRGPLVGGAVAVSASRPQPIAPVGALSDKHASPPTTLEQNTPSSVDLSQSGPSSLTFALPSSSSSSSSFSSHNPPSSLSEVHTSLERMSLLAKSVLREISQEQEALVSAHSNLLQDTQAGLHHPGSSPVCKAPPVSEASQCSNETEDTLQEGDSTDLSRLVEEAELLDQTDTTVGFTHFELPTWTSTSAILSADLPQTSAASLPLQFQLPAVDRQPRTSADVSSASSVVGSVGSHGSVTVGGVTQSAHPPPEGPPSGSAGAGWFALSSHVAH